MMVTVKVKGNVVKEADHIENFGYGLHTIVNLLTGVLCSMGLRRKTLVIGSTVT